MCLLGTLLLAVWFVLKAYTVQWLLEGWLITIVSFMNNSLSWEKKLLSVFLSSFSCSSSSSRSSFVSSAFSLSPLSLSHLSLHLASTLGLSRPHPLEALLYFHIIYIHIHCISISLYIHITTLTLLAYITYNSQVNISSVDHGYTVTSLPFYCFSLLNNLWFCCPATFANVLFTETHWRFYKGSLVYTMHILTIVACIGDEMFK